MRKAILARGGLALLVTLVLVVSARAETTRHGDLKVTFDGKLTPHSLPQTGTAPVGVQVGATIASTGGVDPPSLQRIAIAINRHGLFRPEGLPVCHLEDIQPSTTENALRACRGSLVGQGAFSADVSLSGQAPFPSDGKLFAFNGVVGGRPAILAHVYGTKPVPTSYTLVFKLRHIRGTFGTQLTADLPEATSGSGSVTGLRLSLRRTFRYHGERRSYLSAGCPAPDGIRVAAFSFARATFDFDDGRTLTSTLRRSCRVR